MRSPNLMTTIMVLSSHLCASAVVMAQAPEATLPLTAADDVDFASEMVAGIDRFLLKEIATAKSIRAHYWDRDMSSGAAYDKSIQPNRDRLAHMLGLRETRISFESPEIVSTIDAPGLVAKTDNYRVFSIRWPVHRDPATTASSLPSIYGEGLLLEPLGDVKGNVVAIPDADQTPEQISGVADGVAAPSQFARRAAEAGFRVVVPALISRQLEKQNGRTQLQNREYTYRSTFIIGRHVLGYELQKVLAIVDWMKSDKPAAKVGVIGYGEGGFLTLYAGALDTRIDAVCVSGAFGPREASWQEPLDHNVFGILTEFGHSELATMVLPRQLVVECSQWPEADFSGGRGAPSILKTPPQEDVIAELAGAFPVVAALEKSGVATQHITKVEPESLDSFCGTNALTPFLTAIASVDVEASLAKSASATSLKVAADNQDKANSARQRRMVAEIDRHSQALLRESPEVRKRYMNKLDTSSLDAFAKTVEPYREAFRKEVIGEFDQKLLPFNARSRKSWDEEKWTGHEVVLDVFPDVTAYGVLLIPKDIKPGERRPVVVCQHGLEGRPRDTFLDGHPAYDSYASELCNRGFITFAPQNPYILKDRFRTLQRKSNPLGKSLFSVIVPQHQQIVNWLSSQSYVDPDRIAFYGLSYGGKSAMRIPALVTDYCLSICSGDFSEWVRKCASTRLPFSYVGVGEYEIWEWDLGSTFNYAEMAALICPRPFMVERGHFDGVGSDPWVAYEYAKVRRLYSAMLKIGDKTDIEWFAGPHKINSQGAFDFLHKHLNWPKASEE